MVDRRGEALPVLVMHRHIHMHIEPLGRFLGALLHARPVGPNVAKVEISANCGNLTYVAPLPSTRSEFALAH